MTVEEIEQHLEKKQQEVDNKQLALELLENRRVEIKDSIASVDKMIQERLNIVAQNLSQKNITVDDSNINKEKQEADLKFIEDAIVKFTAQHTVLTESLKPNLFGTLLEQIQSLIKDEKKLPKKKISENVITSGLMGKISKQDDLAGFEWLLVRIEDHSYYGTIVPGTIEKDHFQQALTKKIESLASANAIVANEISSINAILDNLQFQKNSLTNEYKQKAQLQSELQTQIELIQKEEEDIRALKEELKQLEKELDLAKIEAQQAQEIEEKRQQELVEQQGIRTGLTKQINDLLTEYTNAREEKYKIKDRFSNDKEERFKFINKVKGTLNKFAKEDNKDDLVKILQEGIKDFPGIHMQTQLSKAILVLVDDTPENVIKANVAKDILTRQKDINPAYADHMLSLYEQINQMRVYGLSLSEEDERRTVETLANQLENDVNYFINKNEEKIPAADAFKTFQTKFNARAHSQDVLMSHHEHEFAHFAINFALTLVTVGIALLVKVAVSKIFYGQTNTFFSKTGKQAAIEEVEDKLDDAAKTISQPGES